MPYRQKTLTERHLRDVVDSAAGAETSHSLTDADTSLGATSQAEIEGVLDALGDAITAVETKVNEILDHLRRD